jgi:lysophospholipase L1-like esterase
VDVPSAWKAHEGHPGWTIPEVLAINQTWLATAPDFILVHLGTNDHFENHNTSQMLSDMSSLLATIKSGAPNATTFVASIINLGFNSSASAFNAALPALVAAAAASGQRVHFADIANWSGWCKQAVPGFPCTGVHPHGGGYAAMAAAWFQALAPVLPKPQ